MAWDLAAQAGASGMSPLHVAAAASDGGAAAGLVLSRCPEAGALWSSLRDAAGLTPQDVASRCAPPPTSHAAHGEGPVMSEPDAQARPKELCSQARSAAAVANCGCTRRSCAGRFFSLLSPAERAALPASPLSPASRASSASLGHAASGSLGLGSSGSLGFTWSGSLGATHSGVSMASAPSGPLAASPSPALTGEAPAHAAGSPERALVNEIATGAAGRRSSSSGELLGGAADESDDNAGASDYDQVCELRSWAPEPQGLLTGPLFAPLSAPAALRAASSPAPWKSSAPHNSAAAAAAGAGKGDQPVQGRGEGARGAAVRFAARDMAASDEAEPASPASAAAVAGARALRRNLSEYAQRQAHAAAAAAAAAAVEEVGPDGPLSGPLRTQAAEHQETSAAGAAPLSKLGAAGVTGALPPGGEHALAQAGSGSTGAAPGSTGAVPETGALAKGLGAGRQGAGEAAQSLRSGAALPSLATAAAGVRHDSAPPQLALDALAEAGLDLGLGSGLGPYAVAHGGTSRVSVRSLSVPDGGTSAQGHTIAARQGLTGWRAARDSEQREMPVPLAEADASAAASHTHGTHGMHAAAPELGQAPEVGGAAGGLPPRLERPEDKGVSALDGVAGGARGGAAGWGLPVALGAAGVALGAAAAAAAPRSLAAAGALLIGALFLFVAAVPLQ